MTEVHTFDWFKGFWEHVGAAESPVFVVAFQKSLCLKNSWIPVQLDSSSVLMY